MASPIRVNYRYNCACDGAQWEWETNLDAYDASLSIQAGYIIQFLTTRPYPVELVEGFDTALAPVSGYFLTPGLDAFDTGLALISGDLRSIFQAYSNSEPEAIDTALVIQSGDLQVIFESYTDAEPEAIDTALVIQSGTLDAILVTYSNYASEAFDASLALVSGNLEVV